MIEKNFWNEMRRFRNNINRFFAYPDFPEAFDEGEMPVNYRRAWVDFKETENSFIVSIEIPGVNKEDIKVNLLTEPKTIEIKAQREFEKESKDDCEDESVCSCSYSRGYSGFYRTINLPDSADINNINAEYKEGVLNLVIAKTKSSKNSKEIQVN